MPQEITGMQHAVAIDREEIVQIYKLIRPHVRRTPLIEVDGADFGLAGISIVLKLELLQHSDHSKRVALWRTCWCGMSRRREWSRLRAEITEPPLHLPPIAWESRRGFLSRR